MAKAKSGCCVGQRMCPPRCGKTRKRLTIERLKSGATVDAQGHVDKTDDSNWETYIQRNAWPQTRAGNETEQGDQLTAMRTSVWSLWYDTRAANITSQMRVKLPYNGSTRTLNISAVIDVDYAGEVIELHCTENVDG